MRIYMNIHKSRSLILKHFSQRDNEHYFCLADRLCVFHKDGTWETVKTEKKEHAG